ncbi:uncharacterized protein LOC128962770 [Oppia nitens]|uniref:uncharacterized protein LOC128962770 n=1 Tax=Oppia nitens TaxID=1686743 RepID=UPI0023D9BB62|nr:uncharacterized protein LOC128962770 [Oppia nitens]
MINLKTLFRLILVSQETMINWCITMGLLLATKKCPICDNEMKIIVKQLSYRCHQKHGQPHDYRLSALNNTWFSGSKFSIENIIILTYLFSVGTTKYEDIKRETSDLTKTTSHNTISDWLNFCREVVFDWVEKYQSVDLLGGEGVVVEIDETKVGKRKYNRGRLVDGTWILGLVEIQIGANCRRGGRFRLEICPLNKRDADTLLPLIRKHVKIGTTIVSDCWAGYYRLTDNGFVHFTVNHSKEFVNSHTGANTQTIESQWRAMKRNLLRGGIPQDNLYLHLAEYLWRRHLNFGLDYAIIISNQLNM